MTIDKAIETLELHNNPSFQDQAPSLWEALNLGVEALKRIVDQRYYHPNRDNPRLTGEE